MLDAYLAVGRVDAADDPLGHRHLAHLVHAFHLAHLAHVVAGMVHHLLGLQAGVSGETKQQGQGQRLVVHGFSSSFIHILGC
ncbi:hypothetical protein D3C86_1981040 [compost metagenome]